MDKKITISVFVFFISVLPTALGLRAAKPRQIPLRDGFALMGVDGRLIIHDSNKVIRDTAFDRWFFEFDSDLSDGRGLIKAGARLELLPSSILEKMIADANNDSNANYRLWGRVTQYKGKNFIFPTHFMPLAKINKPKLPTSQKSTQQESRPRINEPNDVLTIPKELIDKLPERKKRINHKTREENGEEIKTEFDRKRKSGLRQEFILSDRCGFIRDIGQRTEITWRQTRFVPDALGRTEPKNSLQLLPCQALEQAQRKQSAAPEALRFKVAGIVTKFKGKDYLLLQRATRVYSHGNFPG